MTFIRCYPKRPQLKRPPPQKATAQKATTQKGHHLKRPPPQKATNIVKCPKRPPPQKATAPKKNTEYILNILSDRTFCLLDLLSGFTKHWTFCLLYQVSDWTICLCTFCPLYQVSFGPSVCLDLLSLYQASCTKCLWTKCLWTNCPGTHTIPYHTMQYHTTFHCLGFPVCGDMAGGNKRNTRLKKKNAFFGKQIRFLEKKSVFWKNKSTNYCRSKFSRV